MVVVRGVSIMPRGERGLGGRGVSISHEGGGGREGVGGGPICTTQWPLYCFYVLN